MVVLCSPKFGLPRYNITNRSFKGTLGIKKKNFVHEKKFGFQFFWCANKEKVRNKFFCRNIIFKKNSEKCNFVTLHLKLQKKNIFKFSIF